MGRSLRDRVRSLVLTLEPRAVEERVSERLETKEHRRLLQIARAGTEACFLPTDEAEPLVSVCIPTYVRDRVLLERAVHAALAQTYRRLEVLVVSDAGEERTAAVSSSFDEARIRFINVTPTMMSIPKRGIYGRFPPGSAKRNLALALARGTWIAPSDDDDEMEVDHVESLLQEARARRAEFIYSQARVERASGVWQVVGRAPLERGGIVQGSVLYSSALRFMQYKPTCWKLREWEDWNLWRRMQRIGVRIAFLEHITYTHYLEGPQRALTAS